MWCFSHVYTFSEFDVSNLRILCEIDREVQKEQRSKFLVFFHKELKITDTKYYNQINFIHQLNFNQKNTFKMIYLILFSEKYSPNENKVI